MLAIVIVEVAYHPNHDRVHGHAHARSNLSHSSYDVVVVDVVAAAGKDDVEFHF